MWWKEWRPLLYCCFQYGIFHFCFWIVPVLLNLMILPFGKVNAIVVYHNSSNLGGTVVNICLLVRDFCWVVVAMRFPFPIINIPLHFGDFSIYCGCSSIFLSFNWLECHCGWCMSPFVCVLMAFLVLNILFAHCYFPLQCDKKIWHPLVQLHFNVGLFIFYLWPCFEAWWFFHQVDFNVNSCY